MLVQLTGDEKSQIRTSRLRETPLPYVGVRAGGAGLVCASGCYAT